LTSIKHISNDIVIPYSTHFFNGEKDKDIEEISTKLKRPNVKFVQVPYKEIPVPQNFWIKEMRMQAFGHTKKSWILFLDSDEVLRDEEEFRAFFRNVREGDAYKFANYWYFLSKRRRAMTLEDSIVMVHRSSVHMNQFREMGLDREAFFNACTRKHHMVSKEKPLFDHFSFVRSKEILLKKVQSWGHRKDRNWTSLVEKAFSEDILTTEDFVHGYKYEIQSSTSVI